ncbi:MAG: ABC transporter permease [Clostridiales bacterium]|nr:ABC transporter permease [Clostridiales bacterium]
MSKLFYPKLASTNMKKNSKFYLPYILTCIFTIMMFYNMCTIASHQGLSRMPGAESIGAMMQLGTYVIGIFAVIFLFYTNNFLMRRRKKEIGLYNILGMEKRHIAKVLAMETIYTAVISLVLGILCGILFNRLVVMAMERIVKLPVVLETEIQPSAVITTLLLFGVIFCLCLVSNLAKITLSKPIELLHGQNAGEREPKTKWLLALIGFGCIGTGYYIALTTEAPLAALGLFFVAVILVIIGTYCLFTAGSIFVLKLLRKNKRFYYQAKHFSSISGMIYRMKQNAVGLANICILSTMVLVMVSGTVSLYIGIDDAIEHTFPYDFQIEQKGSVPGEDKAEEFYEKVMELVKDSQLPIVEEQKYHYLSVSTINENGKFIFKKDFFMDNTNVNELMFVTLEDYNKLTNQNLSLTDSEVLIYSDGKSLDSSIELFGKEYRIKDQLSKFPVGCSFDGMVTTVHYIVVPDESNLKMISEGQAEVYNKNKSEIVYRINLDLTGSDEAKKELSTTLRTVLKNEDSKKVFGTIVVECKESNRVEFRNMYGGFLFLGIFLGTLFIMATVLIIYYKQISEGYEDKERFSIMQKVGMSRSEVKKSIHSQVLMVFFLPIVMAGIHVLAAFKMITKLLGVLYLTNVPLFAACTAGTVIVFAIIYSFVYAMTAKTYYKIVG